MGEDAVARVRHSPHRFRMEFRYYAVDHHRRFDPLRFKDAQETIDPADRSVESPRHGVGVEYPGPQYVAHRADARMRTIRPAFECHVDEHGNALAVLPAEVRIQAFAVGRPVHRAD
jgi:hypothetical protein